MNKPCSVVMDLLPLYVDGVCREETVTMIDAHLKTCDSCRKELEALRAPMVELEEEIDDAQPIKALSKSLKKRRGDSFLKGIMLASFVFAVAAMIGYQTADVHVMADGTLVEPFHLIPLAYLAGFTCLVSGILYRVRRKNDPSFTQEEGVYSAKSHQEETKRMSRKDSSRSNWQRYGVAVAIALGVLVAMPNMSQSLAQSMGDIPVVGAFFKVVTFRTYEVEEGNYEVDVKVPAIVEEGAAEGVSVANDATEAYVEKLLKQFKEDNTVGDTAALKVGYEVVRDTEAWFTLMVYATEVGASGYEQSRYYNIDKSTGAYVPFGDNFQDFDGAKEAINAYIIEQMKAEMAADEDKAYFIYSEDESGFETVTATQNYYKNDKGHMVLSFDEYEVAPGYMGVVEFELPLDLVK